MELYINLSTDGQAYEPIIMIITDKLDLLINLIAN